MVRTQSWQEFRCLLAADPARVEELQRRPALARAFPPLAFRSVSPPYFQSFCRDLCKCAVSVDVADLNRCA